jgi:hypothetical protein
MAMPEATITGYLGKKVGRNKKAGRGQLGWVFNCEAAL